MDFKLAEAESSKPSSRRLESVKKRGTIVRGKMRPVREFKFQAPAAKMTRKKYGFPQSQFARLLGISPATQRNWKQERRKGGFFGIVGI